MMCKYMSLNLRGIHTSNLRAVELYTTPIVKNAKIKLVMWKVVRKNKKYDKRKLVVYKDNKKITEAYPFDGWYAMSEWIEDEEVRTTCRSLILSELHWLLGKDCDFFVIREINI